jgi:P4 family phage/plasmid primase-like protien
MESRKRSIEDICDDILEEEHDVSLIQYENYLRSKETSRNDCSHICMENNICYLIGDKEYDFFLKLYSLVIIKGSNKLIELPKKVFPATFQFEYSYDGENGGNVIHLMRRLIEKLFYILKSLFKTELVDNIEECMVARSNGTEQNRSLFIVQFKNIIIYKLVFEFVRNQLLQDMELKEMYGDFQFENTFCDAFKRDPKTLMVGSRFNGELLEYSRYHIGNDLENNFTENLLEIWEVDMLLKYTSIRKSYYSEVMPLSVFGEFHISISPKIIFQNEDFIYEMVEMINPNMAREEDVMWALINISSEKNLFYVMQRFSVNINRTYWNQMLKSPNPEKNHLGISTLVYFSSIYSGKEFKLWMFENIWLFIRNACDKYISFQLDKENDGEEPDIKVNFKSFDSVCYYIGVLSKFLYSNTFVCTDIGKSKWFHFNGFIWKSCNKGVYLSKLFDTNLFSLFQYWSVKLMTEDVANGVKLIRNYYAKCCSDFASFVRNPLKKKMLLTMCAEHFYWDNEHILNQTIKSVSFEEVLDTNKYLIGFRNGVYDLSLDIFRDAKPDDFISLSTQNFYYAYNWSDPIVIEINSFLRKVFPKQDILRYIMKMFASFLDGDIEEQFYIFTGNGSNGKSKLVELFQMSFGEYVGTLPVSLITGKRTPSSSATPELARMKGKRLGVMHESNVSDSINLGLIKAISGGDKMYARALHSDPIEFRPTFQLLLLCNDKPKKIDPYDFAMWRRIVVVNFNSTFIEDPDPEDDTQFKKDINLYKKLTLWKEGFFWILVQYYIELKRHGNPIPEQILFDTNQYRKSNDFVGIFLKLYVERTQYSNDVIYASDLFVKFKTFYVENYQEPNRLKYDNFVSIVSSNLGDTISLERNKVGWTNVIFV